MLARPQLGRNRHRGIGLQVWDPPMAGDACWGLHSVWGRDCQDETAKGGGFVFSIAVGRREVLSGPVVLPGSMFLLQTPLVPRGAVLTPPHVPVPGGLC